MLVQPIVLRWKQSPGSATPQQFRFAAETPLSIEPEFFLETSVDPGCCITVVGISIQEFVEHQRMQRSCTCTLKDPLPT
jgi:hypothetical protein